MRHMYLIIASCMVDMQATKKVRILVVVDRELSKMIGIIAYDM